MQFLTTKQISGEIERVIREANKFIIFVSPYIQISELYLARLRDAEEKHIKIHIVFRRDQLDKIDGATFSGCSNINLYYLDNLHSKCYLNENSAIMTSMNLYDHSEQNNREMGISVSRNENVYNDIATECNSIIKAANPYFIKRQMRAYNRSEIPSGFCIRCTTKIEFNPERPLCSGCYAEWSQYFNYDYVEQCCHRCGEPKETTMSKPLCYDCYKKLTSF